MISNLNFLDQSLNSSDEIYIESIHQVDNSKSNCNNFENIHRKVSQNSDFEIEQLNVSFESNISFEACNLSQDYLEDLSNGKCVFFKNRNKNIFDTFNLILGSMLNTFNDQINIQKTDKLGASFNSDDSVELCDSQIELSKGELATPLGKSEN